MTPAHARRTVGILQPGYLPWLGFFEQLSRSDVFVILDDIQYDKHAWRNRNRIKTAQGPIWLTVPVLTHGKGRPLTRDVVIDPRSTWRKKHLDTIRQSYRRAPFGEWAIAGIEAAYAREWERLLDLDLFLIAALNTLLGLERDIVLSSSLNVQGRSTERLVAICRAVGATAFYEGASGRDYLDVGLFEANGIALEFQSYRHPEYPQSHGAFEPYLSVFDLLANCGPRSPEILRT